MGGFHQNGFKAIIPAVTDFCHKMPPFHYKWCQTVALQLPQKVKAEVEDRFLGQCNVD